VFIFLILYMVSGYSCSNYKEVDVNRTAPDFTLYDLQSKKTVSLSDFRGKTILLRFWADWCPTCSLQMPELDQLYRRYRDKGFVIVAVNVMQSEEDVKNFIEKHKLTYPVLLDKDGEISRLYSITGIPTNLLIDKDMAIREIVKGDNIRKILKRLPDLL